VETIVDRIRKGDFFQTNICRVFTARITPALSWPLYLRMRSLNPARYAAYLRLDHDRTVLSMSPELFLKVKNGVVESHPIKGTRARGADETSDRLAQTELLQSEKDAAELAMIVDVVRNDLSRVCETGSVQVPEHASLLTLPSIHHTYSRVSGRLKRDSTVADLLKASFPPASITGAPKIAAVQAALREEGSGRGPCMGAIGWISMKGDLELSVAIRTAFTEGESIHYMAGCGVTSGSIPEAELVESQVKASAFITALTGSQLSIHETETPSVKQMHDSRAIG
jgi:para-aminobenzoate synthetase component 1